jgi:protein-S-isoprenylcysteine O-methyltransferase Ste14
MSNGSSTDTAGASWMMTIASLAVGAAFFSLWFWLLPLWLRFDVAAVGSAPWRWIGAVPSILGFSVALRCIWDFGRTGRGTPAPFIPPRRLVVVGFYRYVRNPMYVGFFAGWMGLWVVFGSANRAALLVLLVATAAVVLFVKFYEEPTLRKMFGADYEAYCLNVPRWIPRLRPWSL